MREEGPPLPAPPGAGPPVFNVSNKTLLKTAQGSVCRGFCSWGGRGPVPPPPLSPPACGMGRLGSHCLPPTPHPALGSPPLWDVGAAGWARRGAVLGSGLSCHRQRRDPRSWGSAGVGSDPPLRAGGCWGANAAPVVCLSSSRSPPSPGSGSTILQHKEVPRGRLRPRPRQLRLCPRDPGGPRRPGPALLGAGLRPRPRPRPGGTKTPPPPHPWGWAEPLHRGLTGGAGGGGCLSPQGMQPGGGVSVAGPRCGGAPSHLLPPPPQDAMRGRGPFKWRRVPRGGGGGGGR